VESSQGGHLLSLIVFLPTIAAVLVLMAPMRLARVIAVLGSLATFALSLLLFRDFAWWQLSAEQIFGTEYGSALHHVTQLDWINVGRFKIQYFLGVDGLSFPLVILTTLISSLSCLASWNMDKWKINKGQKAYFALFLLLETGMLGVFVALDFFLFYIFWEVMLLPMYFLIGVWGGPRKEYAAIKFFLYTLAGSVLMLVALVACYFFSAEALGGEGTFNLITLATDGAIREHFNNPDTLILGMKFSSFMFIFLAIGFAIKVPTVPFHTWLPDAHVEAPTPVSMILAGVLLKMGAYGFLRIAYPIFPAAGLDWSQLVAAIGVISILYGALCAMAQTDFKKLVAYSSISHMGFVMLGISVMTDAGIQGAMFQVIAHGISSPMCFFLVGIIYDRAHHREINRFGGLWLSMPVYGSMATLGFFASLGLPGLCGFIGEIWVLLGAFGAAEVHPEMTWARPYAIAAAFGIVLTAGYILWMMQRVYLGPERDEYKDFPQASTRELGILVPLAVLTLVLGILPQHSLFNFMNGTLTQIIEQMDQVTTSIASLAG